MAASPGAARSDGSGTARVPRKVVARIVPQGRGDRLAERIAKVYTETISKLSPRIVVHGKPQYLQADRTVYWIRTLLFAGLRSAFLWRQLGGNRWRLMFGRKRLLADTEALLSG